MTRSVAAIWLGTITLMGGLLVPAGWRAANAAHERTTAALELASLTAQARELTSLKAATPMWIGRQQPDSALAPKVSATLAAAGLPPSTLQSLSGESAALVTGGVASGSQRPAMRRRGQLTLSGLTLPELGKFLSAWRQENAGWTVASLEVAPENGSGTGGSKPGRDLVLVGGDMPLRVVLGLETVYLDQPGPVTSTTATSAPGLSAPARSVPAATAVDSPKPKSSSQTRPAAPVTPPAQGPRR